MVFHPLVVKMVARLMLLIMKKTGLICDGGNLDDIYSSINSMLENKKYLEYGKNAKEFVSKFYWPNIIEEYKKILS
jgi:phosphatidylinositol alpha-1,6-mannosyltransferase